MRFHFFDADETVFIRVVRSELVVLAVVSGCELGPRKLAVLVGIHLIHAALAFTAFAFSGFIAATAAFNGFCAGIRTEEQVALGEVGRRECGGRQQQAASENGGHGDGDGFFGG